MKILYAYLRQYWPLVLLALALSACGPRLPKGVDADKLDQAVSDAIGGAQTCMLIGRKGSGEVVWRYNTHTTCARTLTSPAGPTPPCAGSITRWASTWTTCSSCRAPT